MIETVANSRLSIKDPVRAIHRLEEEVFKCELLKIRGVETDLREDQFQLFPGLLDKPRPRLGTDTKPVHALRSLHGSIGFHRNFEVEGVQRVNQSSIQLEQRLAARANDEFPVRSLRSRS